MPNEQTRKNILNKGEVSAPHLPQFNSSRTPETPARGFLFVPRKGGDDNPPLVEFLRTEMRGRWGMFPTS